MHVKVGATEESEEIVRKRQKMSTVWDHFKQKNRESRAMCVLQTWTGLPQQHFTDASTSEQKVSVYERDQHKGKTPPPLNSGLNISWFNVTAVVYNNETQWQLDAKKKKIW